MIVFTYYGRYVDLSKVVSISPLRYGDRFSIHMMGCPTHVIVLADVSEDEAQYVHPDLLNHLKSSRRDAPSKEALAKVVLLHSSFIAQWRDYVASREAAAVKIMDAVQRNPTAAVILAEMLHKLTPQEAP
ncbi:hypothetical protein HOU00_gp181 [Caulobacter phage CcrPW]|uniref:Uncharacterized protein n=1 Tax=Caulobacter phage CcrPW TaxID=2283271 RepID=A0A385EAQ3_9CAUD|nr:hypothetical protein HOU00_gp181 [Caulobacter phage CcrPW]AXQ68944.1 hypothetical protein CcrPW_gp405 [Caulobacter phage CcrPW]